MPFPEATILRELVGAGQGFVSGNFLAQQLGVSRVAIWSHVEKLRLAGFDLEARPRLGYRLRKAPEEVNPLLLQALLPPDSGGLEIHFHESIDSTNSEAERLLAAGSPAPFVVIARAQSAGRGRLGRQWFSRDSGNLYLSFVFQPRLPPQQMQTFTVWMGAAICKFLNRHQHVPARIKWPNDLLLGGKKIGGMLTEARIDSDRIRDLVFGLGLNVNGRQESFPPELRGAATSIAAATESELCLNRFTASLLVCVMEGYQSFTTRAGDETELHRLWAEYDSLLGRTVTACQGNRSLSGIARGIDEQGCLLLEQPDGTMQRVSAGDVTLQKTPPP